MKAQVWHSSLPPAWNLQSQSPVPSPAPCGQVQGASRAPGHLETNSSYEIKSRKTTPAGMDTEAVSGYECERAGRVFVGGAGALSLGLRAGQGPRPQLHCVVLREGS
jgi:hypothetical protein